MNTTRRSFVLLAGAAALPVFRLAAQSAGNILVPHASWDCGMPDGIPNPESGTLIFEAQMKLERLAALGKTPYGTRRVAVGTEGTVSGPKLTGTVMTGALD